MTILLRVNLSCPHCLKIFLPILTSNADFDFYLITDIDSRVFGLPGGSTPVFIGAYEDGDIAYFDNFAPLNPLLVIEAYKILQNLVDKPFKEKTAGIPHDFVWILNEF